jgi:sigma-B regulation protein RsbU (phosphoserine phosphatase)
VTRGPLSELSALAERSRERFEQLASRFAPRKPPPAFREDYWRALRELFTRDVTPQGLRELMEHEAQETFRFLTREVSLDDLVPLPWYERHPKALWRFFLAIAYRLSPWRRVLFAVAVIALAAGWIGLVFHLAGVGFFSLEPLVNVRTWLVASATVLFFLLALELRDKLGLKGDLEVARQIQFGLLPFEPIERDGIAIATVMRPANTVGGDYFDVIDLEPARIAIAVGDVAGKGMPAALLMALLQGSLRTLLSAGFRGEELIAKLNLHLCASIPSNRLVTLFYGELDTANRRLSYINCGHNPGLLLSAGAAPARLAATAIALGVTAEAAFPAVPLDLVPGDRLVLYTDGVTEAENARDEEFSDARLAGWLQARRDEPARLLIDGVIAEVLRHCGGVRPRDDMTLLCLDAQLREARSMIAGAESSGLPPAAGSGPASAAAPSA